MTIRHLTTFITVCDCWSATKAAERLHIAQPSVSQTIAELEKFYGIILFERIRQRLILTDTGKILLQKAKEIIENFKEFEAIATTSPSFSGIKIGASLTVGKILMPIILKNIFNEFPSVHPYISINRTSHIEEELLNGNLDFAIVEGNISSDLSILPVAQDRLSAVCGVNYPIQNNITLSELVKEKLLLREKGSASRDMLDNLFALHNLSPRPLIESASNEALIAAAIKDLGIAVLPGALVKPFLSTKKLRSIHLDDVCLRRKIYLITHKNKKLSVLQKQIYQMCLQETPCIFKH